MIKSNKYLQKPYDALTNTKLYIWSKNKILSAPSKFVSMIKKGSIKNLLSFSSFFKLLFIYVMIVFYIIIFTFDFSSFKVFTHKDVPKIAVYGVIARIGEHRSYIRTLKAAKKLGWEYFGSSFDERFANDPWSGHFYKVATNIVTWLTKPEFSIAMTHYVKIIPVSGYNLVYLNVPDVMLYSLKHHFRKEFSHLEKYDGYIDLDSVMSGENKLLASILKNHNHSDALVIPAYLAYDLEELILPTEYKHAVITGSLWGCNRGSFRFKDAIQNLAKNNLLIAYGLPESYDYLGSGYLGTMEKHGDPDRQLVLKQREAGIALVVHNFEHLVQGLPTSRFAEAISAGAVIISDKHPFLERYFGDTALYFDSFKSSDEIYMQIKRHIEWIKDNPEKVREMSYKAHEIFSKDWALEVQLKKVMEEVKAKKVNSQQH